MGKSGHGCDIWDRQYLANRVYHTCLHWNSKKYLLKHIANFRHNLASTMGNNSPTFQRNLRQIALNGYICT